MSTYKDALKGSQGGAGNFVKLPIVKYYSIKDGKFASWNKELEANDITDSISGVLIGTAMKMSVFDNNFGKNGGTHVSTWYFTNQDRVAVYAPDGKTKEFTGTAEAAAEYLANETRATVKKRYCLFMSTKEGLVEVQSNVTLTISLTNTMRGKNKDVFIDNVVTLKPAVYTPDDFDKKVHKILGKLVDKNPPNYATITPVQAISDAIAQQLNLEELALTFTKWKAQITHGKEAEAKEIAQENPQPTVDNYRELAPEPQPSGGEDAPVITDDLPFKISPNYFKFTA